MSRRARPDPEACEPDALAFVAEVGPERAPELLELYAQAWWSRERNASDTERILRGSPVALGFEDVYTGRLVAFARALTDGVAKAVVYDVIVDPSRRGSGLGRALMRRLLDHPLVADVSHVELYCLPELLPFYAELGYAEPSEGLRLLRRRE